MEGQIRVPRLAGPRAKPPIPEEVATRVSGPSLDENLPETKCRGYVLVAGMGTQFIESYGGALRNLGFTPLFALKCEATTAYLRLFLFDFVLLDHQRWNLEGSAIVDETRKLEHQTPVLVVVPRQDMHKMNAAQQLGVRPCQIESNSFSGLEKVIYELPYDHEGANRLGYRPGASFPTRSEGARVKSMDGAD